MKVIQAIESKIKELMEQKFQHQSLASKLAHDLEVTKVAINKIEGALEAFYSATAGIKNELGISGDVSASAGANVEQSQITDSVTCTKTHTEKSIHASSATLDNDVCAVSDR